MVRLGWKGPDFNSDVQAAVASDGVSVFCIKCVSNDSLTLGWRWRRRRTRKGGIRVQQTEETKGVEEGDDSRMMNREGNQRERQTEQRQSYRSGRGEHAETWGLKEGMHRNQDILGAALVACLSIISQLARTVNAERMFPQVPVGVKG